MTVTGWVIVSIFCFIVIIIGASLAYAIENIPAKIAVCVMSIILIAAMIFGGFWYFKNTESGKRAIVSQKSELGNGLLRTVTVYTADGKIIAQYEGRIDIEEKDGGYVLFDFEGKRYTYYNCFIESIADIE